MIPRDRIKEKYHNQLENIVNDEINNLQKWIESQSEIDKNVCNEINNLQLIFINEKLKILQSVLELL